MKTVPTTDTHARGAASPGALLRVFQRGLPLLTLLAAIVAREYAGFREELSRINAGEPGYEDDREIRE